MYIVEATEIDIPVIHELAKEIWWPTYRPILAEDQISFMLEDMYSPDALREQMRTNVIFVLVKKEGADIAFAGYSIDTEQELLKIHKIYLLPSEQGKGTGKTLIDYLSNVARESKIPEIELNVNRANPALAFYEKMGFRMISTVDIPYHQYILNDYVMRKDIYNS